MQEIVEKKPFDPNMWADVDKKEASSVTPQVTNPSVAAVPVSDDLEQQVRDLTDILVSRGTDITAGYENWFHLGLSLADGLGESGRSYFDQLSRLNSTYNPKECDDKFTECLNHHNGSITIRTFFQMAKDAGIDLSDFTRSHRRSLPVSATSAIPPTAKSPQKVQNSIVSGVLDTQVADGGLAEMADNPPSHGSGYTFSDKLQKDDLPDLLQKVYDLHASEPAKCDAQLLGVLNVVSGLMGGANGSPDNRSGIYGVYDGRIVYAPTYNIIYSSAGNDKGNLIFCKQLARDIRQEMRRAYEQERTDYERLLSEWETQSKKDRGPAPKEPAYRDPFVPGNSSSSAVYRALQANGGWGLLYETEADTVSSMIDSDYGNYSDLMRKAFHHESLSMTRVTEKLHIDIEEPRLSILLTCTPGQLPSLFPSFENGLGSRYLYYYLPDDEVVFHNVFARRDTPLENSYRQLGQDLMPLYRAMQARVGHPVQFLFSQQQESEFLDVYGEMLTEQFHMLGKGIRAFIFRMALSCFRYAMILSALRRLADWRHKCEETDSSDIPMFPDLENGLNCDDRDYRTAMTIIGSLIFHTARVYSVLAKEDDNPFAQKGIHLSKDELRVYQALPAGEFRTADFIQLAQSLGIAERTAQRMLCQFCNVQRIIEPLRRGVYLKSERKEE